jgi:hypothetical protein
MRSRARLGVPAAAVAPGTASPAAGRPTGVPLIAAMLIAAAALDLTRCSLILMTFRHVAPTVGLVAAGIGAAVVSVTAARGYRAGQRWAAWAALLIGVASAPQASASGFRNPYTIPDVATAALGVLLTVAILATVGRTGRPVQHLEIPCVMSRDGRLSSSSAAARPCAGQWARASRSMPCCASSIRRRWRLQSVEPRRSTSFHRGPARRMQAGQARTALPMSPVRSPGGPVMLRAVVTRFCAGSTAIW